MKNIKIAIAFSCLLSSSALGTTLSEALVSTYQNNPELIAEREKLKTIDEKMSEAISGFLPKVTYKATKTNSKSDASTSRSQNGITTTKSDVWTKNKAKTSGLKFEQNLFNGGKTVMAIQIAKYTIESARAELLAKEQEIFLKAITAYLKVITAKENLDITTENYQAYQKKHQAIDERYQAGVAKKSDLALSEAAMANASTESSKASSAYMAAVATYIQVIGIEPENLAIEKNLSNISSNQIEFLQKALKANPELSSVYYKKKATDINLVSSAASMLPSVDLEGAINKDWQNNRDSSTSNPYSNNKVIGISMTVPIYNKGQEYSAIRSSSADAARLKYSLKNARNSVTQSTTQSWNNYKSYLQAIHSAKEAVKASTIALEGKQQEYDEGIGTLTDLLNAQENFFDYKLRLANVEQELELSIYQMASLTGELNARALSLPTKLYNPSANYDKIKFELIGF